MLEAVVLALDGEVDFTLETTLVEWLLLDEEAECALETLVE